LLSIERVKQYTNLVKGRRGGRRGWRRKMRKEEEVEGKDVFNCMEIYIVAFFVMTPCRLLCSQMKLAGLCCPHLT
jgi:hypothetical protein